MRLPLLTASIYASIISRSSAMCSSPFGGNFLRAVTRHRDRFKGDLSHQQLQLRRAVKANEVAWGDIDRALEALGPSYNTDPTLGKGRESGRQSRDCGESPSQECQLSYLNGLCLTRFCSHTRWWYIYPCSWRGPFISAHIPGRGQFLWIWEKFGQ